ncbi:MAG: hypothetical protein ACUVQY_10025 [Thermoproteota archaeon]
MRLFKSYDQEGFGAWLSLSLSRSGLHRSKWREMAMEAIFLPQAEIAEPVSVFKFLGRWNGKEVNVWK